MDALCRFILRHRRLWLWIVTLISYAICIAAVVVYDVPFLAVIVFFVLIALPLMISPSIAFTQLIQKRAQFTLRECDPYPMIELTEELLALDLAEINRQEAIIQRAGVLDAIGEKRQALDMMLALNIDKVNATPQYTKFIYYGALFEMLADAGDTVRASMTHSKAMQIYADMKQSKIKKSLDITVNRLQVDLHIMNGEYDAALELMARMAPLTRLHAVDDADRRSKIFLHKGDLTSAEEQLRFIIANGNKLALVDDAIRRLAELEASEK